MLTDDQKRRRLDISSFLLSRYEDGPETMYGPRLLRYYSGVRSRDNTDIHLTKTCRPYPQHFLKYYMPAIVFSHSRPYIRTHTLIL